MSINFPNGVKSAIEQQLFMEEKRYIDALRSDAEFHVVKKIRQKIQQLKSELAEQSMRGPINGPSGQRWQEQNHNGRMAE